MKQKDIKFRAWIESTPSGVKPKRMDYLSNETLFMWESDGVGMKIMQFTGLKDKNGKEIYEGDILTYEGITSNGHKIIREVNYNVDFSRFQSGMYPLFQNIESAIVLGNIFESPELLHKVK